jgi:hypothetical protein
MVYELARVISPSCLDYTEIAIPLSREIVGDHLEKYSMHTLLPHGW